MQPHSPDSKRFFEQAASQYHEALMSGEAMDAIEYLQGRGFGRDIAEQFRLGAVLEPLEGHERMVGCIAIPNICGNGHPVGFKFRRLAAEGPKYDSAKGEKKRIFNAQAFTLPSDVIAITEGEFDCMAVMAAGIPAVSIPTGARSWKVHHAKLFSGYRRVLVVADSDEPGQELAEVIEDSVLQARRVTLPQDCKDINEVLVAHGVDGVKEVLA